MTIGNEISDGNGLRLHNYTVGGMPIWKAGNNWASDELGRLDFDGDTWDSWNATSDDQPTGRAPSLTINGPADGSIAASRTVTFSGTTNAARLTIRVNGTETGVPLRRRQVLHHRHPARHLQPHRHHRDRRERCHDRRPAHHHRLRRQDRHDHRPRR